MEPTKQFDEAYFAKTGIKIPPPEQRLCKKHGKPIQPYAWAYTGHRTTGCSRCIERYSKSPQAKVKRAKKWESEFIPCIHHPNRRCNRYRYVNRWHRFCSSCFGKRIDGSLRPKYVRNLNKKAYKRSLVRRSQLGGTLRGLALFERSTGLKLTLPNMRIIG